MIFSPYFLYLTKTPISLILQIWQLYSVLDTLAPFFQLLIVYSVLSILQIISPNKLTNDLLILQLLIIDSI